MLTQVYGHITTAFCSLPLIMRLLYGNCRHRPGDVCLLVSVRCNSHCVPKRFLRIFFVLGH